MSFQQALSGLAGAAKQLDVIGNNIANSGTVGFKQSQVQFADIYARSLAGSNGNVAGIGVAVGRISQQFAQGNIENSANPLDMAINGSGFFRTSVDGAIQYSRNGQFEVDKNGYIINAQLAKVTGYLADSQGKILAGAPVPIQIDPTDMMPVATSKVQTQVNLNSASVQPSVTPFDANDPLTYNKQIPTEVFDTLGNSHTLSTYYVKTGANNWDVYAAVDNRELNTAAAVASIEDSTTGGPVTAARATYQALLDSGSATTADATTYADAVALAMSTEAETLSPGSLADVTAATGLIVTGLAGTTLTPDEINLRVGAAVKVPPVLQGKLVFDSSGVLSRADTINAMTAAGTPSTTLPLTLTLPIFPDTGAFKPLTLAFDPTGSTQIFAATSEKKTTQDGYSGGALTTFASSAEGVIMGQYSNGLSRPLAQIVLADFPDTNALQPLGNNAWAETSASGSPLVGTPNTGKLGLLRSSATESSNVDLTAELVNMITAQRAYQANAQTIKTQDSVMQTLVNLR